MQEIVDHVNNKECGWWIYAGLNANYLNSSLAL